MAQTSDAIVAVLDSGVDPRQLSEFHGFRAAAILPGPHPSDWVDQCGHGTRVAATILTVTPEAKILPVCVTDEYGALRSPARLADALNWTFTRCQRRQSRIPQSVPKLKMC